MRFLFLVFDSTLFAASSYVNCPQDPYIPCKYFDRQLSICKCASNFRIILKSKVTIAEGKKNIKKRMKRWQHTTPTCTTKARARASEKNSLTYTHRTDSEQWGKMKRKKKKRRSLNVMCYKSLCCVRLTNRKRERS